MEKAKSVECKREAEKYHKKTGPRGLGREPNEAGREINVMAGRGLQGAYKTDQGLGCCHTKIC